MKTGRKPKETNSVVYDHLSRLTWSRVATVLLFKIGIQSGLNDLVKLFKAPMRACIDELPPS